MSFRQQHVANEILPGGMSGFISRATFAKDTSWRAEISVEAENITSTNIRFVFYRFQDHNAKRCFMTMSEMRKFLSVISAAESLRLPKKIGALKDFEL